jgi:hypothetical protein
MTPEQALAVLYQASRIASLTAADHDKCNEAAKVLQDVITPKTKTK